MKNEKKTKKSPNEQILVSCASEAHKRGEKETHPFYTVSSNRLFTLHKATLIHGTTIELHNIIHDRNGKAFENYTKM